MKLSLTATLSFALALIVSAPAQAAPIVQYNFNDDDAVADFEAPNISATSFTAGTGLLDVVINDNIEARGWNPSNSAANAIAAGDYWWFTVTADAGFQFDVIDISLDEKRIIDGVKDDGPLLFQIWSGGALVGSQMATSSSLQNHTINLTGNDLTSLEIRIIGWNASSNGNGQSEWSLDNVFLNGTVEPKVVVDPHLLTTPEPASLLLLGTGLLGGAWRMRRRQSKSV